MKPNRVPTATRLTLAFGGIVLVVALTGAWVLGGLAPGDAALGEQSRRDSRELDLALQLQAAALAAGQAARASAAAPAAAASAAAVASGVPMAGAAGPMAFAPPAEQALERYARLRQQLDALPPSPQAAQARAALDAAASSARLLLLPVIAGGAEAVTGVPPPLAAQAQAVVQDWSQALQAHAQAVSRAAVAREQEAGDRRAAEQRALALALVCAALLAAALGVWAVRGLRRELGTDPGQLKAAAERLGQGELYHALDRRDSSDSVVDAFDRMREALAALALAVRHAAHDTAGAGRELAAGQDDLRGRVEQQALMLGQALAAVQALGVALRRGAEEARQAAGLAGELQELAARSGAAVAAAVDGVRELQAGERRLGELVQAVEGVAFQAHLLAVNAALESARAESPVKPGGGVAVQVRELSQRFADTARQLRAQAGAHESALAQRALALSAQADTALQTLGTVAHRLARSGAGLDLLARDQAGDAERIDRTLLELDQATRQTALMAERNAASAQALRAHSGQLLAALSPLKPLPGSGHDIGPAPPLEWALPVGEPFTPGSVGIEGPVSPAAAPPDVIPPPGPDAAAPAADAAAGDAAGRA
jgi:methyl-accepting chemotaxis protein